MKKRFAPVLRLSRQEFRVFVLLGKGLTVSEIAKLPGEVLSVKTVSTYNVRAREKLGMSNRQIACYAAAFLEHQHLLKKEPNPEALPYKWSDA